MTGKSIKTKRLVLVVLLLISVSTSAHGQGARVIDYDVVYIRAPRYGDNVNTKWPEIFDPINMEPGGDLMLLHPNGTQEVLFAGGNGAVVDPTVSFDAQWVFFSYFPDLRPDLSIGALNSQRRNAPVKGADIYKINLASRQVVRLTQQIWTPPAGNWSTNHLTATPAGTHTLGYGIFNLGPCPLPDGRVMFTSSRDGYLPNKDFTFPNLRLYIMDADGRNVEPIGHLNIGSALHPTVLADGRVMFSSYEGQGLRDRRLWGLWALWPDGRKWEPLFSAFTSEAGEALHFQTQLSDRRIVVVEYYNLNNNGFGTALAFDPTHPAGMPPFGSPNRNHASNPAVRRGIWWFDPSHPSHMQPRYTKYSFSPPGLTALSGFTHGEDSAASRALDGNWAGKVTHPSGAPNNDLLLVWTPGPANDLNRPTTIPYYDGGLYILRAGQSLTDHRHLVLIKNDPAYNEMQPRAVVPYSAIYGIPQPASLPFLPNDGSDSPSLAPGTPFGLVGTSSFYKRNTSPGKGVARFAGLDPFNTSENGASSNWFSQGSDAGKYTNADIHAVRIVGMEGVAHRSYGPAGNQIGFMNHAATERLRILGEILLRKSDANGNPVLDPDGNPDTSFLARIPADTPLTFQTLDKDGLVLNTAQTWHMVRPGESRTDCGGCHAHSQVGTQFSATAAARADYRIVDLVNKTPILTKNANGVTTSRELNQRQLDVEYYRDIKPILQRSCVSCHSGASAAAGLVLDDTAVVNGYENTYNRLANDRNAQYGIKPVISTRTWRETNASRYVRMFQSRRSLLAWKVFGRRLDGWTNADHPTESTPGDPATLPQGALANDADIDFTGSMMPPPNSGMALTADEKMTIARWIDLGCPINSPNAILAQGGWFADELKPTLTVSSPRAGANVQAIQVIRIGMYDSYSGLDRNSLSVVANFAVNGVAAGGELGPLFQETGDHVWTLSLSTPLTSLAGQLTVKVKDMRGNLSTISRSFSSGTGGGTATLSSVSCSPSSLNTPGTATCTVTLSQDAPAGGATVTLGSNNASLTTPPSVDVTAGSMAATFTANAAVVSATASAQITASWNGVPQTTALTLVAPVTLSAIACAPSTLSSGASTTCTATLNKAADAGGFVVNLISGNPAALPVPGSVSIAVGATTANFITTVGTVASQQAITLTASANGVSRTASVTVNPSAAVTLRCTPAVLTTPTSAACTITRTTPAPAGGSIFQLRSNDRRVTVPSSVTVQAGQTQVAFRLVARTGTAASNQAVIITATSGSSTVTFTLTLITP